MNGKVGIILEGGAMRSIFSAGILDYYAEKNIEISNILAVSAGAYVGMNYVSGQHRRVVDSIIKPLEEEKYLGLGTFFRKGTFFDMDFLFEEIQKKRVPFDFKSFVNSNKRFVTTTIDCRTGNTCYHEKFEDLDDFIDVLRAANSMPLLAKVAYYKGIPMLDGGMGDAIPLNKALEEGWDKIIVVLTRDTGYRKKKRHLYLKIINAVYHKYPNFVKLIEERSERYNACLDRLKELEQEGSAFIYRPSKITVSNSEADVKTLMEYYQHGYDNAKEREEELREFLNK